MATKKSALTFDELNAQIAALQAQAAEVRRKEVAEVIGKIKSAVLHYGLTAEDLGLAAKQSKKSKLPAAVASTPKGQKKGPRDATVKKSALPVKYKDDAGNTWVGHGKRPKWFVDAIAAGKSAEDMLVKRAA
jgi:DNA-binding protein H-NS